MQLFTITFVSFFMVGVLSAQDSWGDGFEQVPSLLRAIAGQDESLTKVQALKELTFLLKRNETAGHEEKKIAAELSKILQQEKDDVIRREIYLAIAKTGDPWSAKRIEELVRFHSWKDSEETMEWVVLQYLLKARLTLASERHVPSHEFYSLWKALRYWPYWTDNPKPYGNYNPKPYGNHNPKPKESQLARIALAIAEQQRRVEEQLRGMLPPGGVGVGTGIPHHPVPVGVRVNRGDLPFDRLQIHIGAPPESPRDGQYAPSWSQERRTPRPEAPEPIRPIFTREVPLTPNAEQRELFRERREGRPGLRP